MSPRAETFDRGGNPYQRFMKVRDARDSLVHLSENKVSQYWAIDVELVKRAAMTAGEIIEGVSKFLTVDGRQVTYPFWLKRPRAKTPQKGWTVPADTNRRIEAGGRSSPDLPIEQPTKF